MNKRQLKEIKKVIDSIDDIEKDVYKLKDYLVKENLAKGGDILCHLYNDGFAFSYSDKNWQFYGYNDTRDIVDLIEKQTGDPIIAPPIQVDTKGFVFPTYDGTYSVRIK